MRLIDADALKEVIPANHYLLSTRNNSIDYGMFTTGIMQAIDNALTVSIKSCYECPFVADEEKQITNSDTWESYCVGQEVGFKKAEYVFERMKLVQETVNTILNYCSGDTDIDKAFRNAARLVQNAIDGKSVDFEEIERSEEE